MKNPFQWIALKTIMHREIVRMFRIWPQTFLPPVITQGLYFLIFGTFIGSQIAPIQGINYMSYIVPGIVMMSIITAAYTNVVFSFFGSKFQRSIEEIIVSPVSNATMLAGYVSGGIFRAFSTGLLVFLVSVFFTRPLIQNVFVILIFALLTSIVFALGGFLNSLYAKKFDDVNIFTTFVLTPLTYLGGVFYSLDMLPPFFKTVSYANPIVYMVDGFRYGFYGIADTNPYIGFGFLLAVAAVLTWINLRLLKQGKGIRQ